MNQKRKNQFQALTAIPLALLTLFASAPLALAQSAPPIQGKPTSEATEQTNADLSPFE